MPFLYGRFAGHVFIDTRIISRLAAKTIIFPYSILRRSAYSVIYEPIVELLPPVEGEAGFASTPFIGGRGLGEDV